MPSQSLNEKLIQTADPQTLASGSEGTQTLEDRFWNKKQDWSLAFFLTLPHLGDIFTDTHNFYGHQNPEPKKAIRTSNKYSDFRKGSITPELPEVIKGIKLSVTASHLHSICAGENSRQQFQVTPWQSWPLFLPGKETEHTLEPWPQETTVTYQSNSLPQTLAAVGTRKFSTP